MPNLKNIKEAKLEIRAAAIERWVERESIRQQVKRDIELQGAGSADSFARQTAFAKRLKSINQINTEFGGIELPLGIERRMGPTLDWSAHAPNERIRKAGRPVARLVPLTQPNIEPIGFGTGFLISPDLLITNWHVFPSRADAVGSAANFLYEDTVDGISRGLTFELDPKRFFVSNQELDFAIVAVAPHTERGELLVDLGQITLIETRPKILRGHPINIIQYPNGGTKKYATSNNRLLDILEDEGLLHYETDTLEGSSGSPAFSALWELIALHHMSIPAIRNGKILTLNGEIWREGMSDEAIQWIANEGIRISAIVEKLSTIDVDTFEEGLILKSLLATTKDPIPEALAAISRQKMETNKFTESQQKLSDNQFQKESIMPEIQFNFSGPVTININTPPQSLIKDLSNQPIPEIDKGIEASIRFDQDYEARDGYNPQFLDDTGKILVPTPHVASHRLTEIYTNDNGEPLVLKYHHFELIMNKKRRLQMWSAVNVDYSPERKIDGDRKSWGSDRWIPDPRIPANVQIFDADFYKPAGNIDRGHMVRREDNEWGDDRLEIEYANADTFHWTNCTPQHEAFNQSTPGQYNKDYRRMEGTWGAFENHLQKSRKGSDAKASIIAGPILSDEDPSADFGKGPIQYPIRFFKIICVVENISEERELKVFGFIFSQQNVVDEFGIERFNPGKFSQYQVPLTSIEEATGLEFGEILHQHDTMAGQSERLINSIDQVTGVTTVIN